MPSEREAPFRRALKQTLVLSQFAQILVAFWTDPQKRPMIGLTSRPPQLETPFSVFNQGVITPNDAFFVRYHLADVPLNIDPATFSVEIKGKIDKPLKLSLAEIRKMPAVEIVAVRAQPRPPVQSQTE